MEKFEAVQHRTEQLQAERQPVDSMLKDIYKYILPGREVYMQYGENASRHHLAKDVYDGNPVAYLQLFTNGFFGNMCAPNTHWQVPTIPDKWRQPTWLENRWMQLSNRQIYSHYANAGFYTNMEKFIKDFAAGGTATMFTGWSPKKSHAQYLTRHPGEIYLDVDEEGDYDTVIRICHMTSAQIYLKFQDIGDLPAQVVRDVEDEGGNPFRWNKVIHAVYPRTKADIYLDTALSYKYASVWQLYGGGQNQEDQHVIHEGGYKVFPYVVHARNRDSAEIYGRGIGHDAYYDILTVNQFKKTLIQTAQQVADPEKYAPIEWREQNRYRRGPGRVSWYDDPGRIPMTADHRANYPVGVDAYGLVLDTLKKHFMVEFFMMLQDNKQRMTAYEVSERMAEKIATLGATVGQFSSDVLDKLGEFTMAALLTRGIIPAPPETLRAIEFDYNGPLAVAQRRMAEGQGMTRVLEQILPIMQLYQSAGNHIKWPAYVEKIMELNGAPYEIINTPEETKAIGDAQAQAQAQQQQLEAMDALGGAKALSEKPEQGSPMEAMIQ
jgi:hypothetical protein